MRLLVIALLVSATCTSCARLDDVERDWGETMARYKLIGVFPPTEDLQPGDVLLDVPPAAGADPQPQVQRLGALDLDLLRPAISRQDARRLRFERTKPDTPASSTDKAAPDKTTGSTVSAVATAQPGSSITTTTTIRPVASVPSGKPSASKPPQAGKPDPSAPAHMEVLDADSTQTATNPVPRFRRVALPGIVAARVYDWQIAGAGPIGRLAIGLGLSGNGSAAVLIGLKKLETLGFDTLSALDLLETSIVPWLRANGATPEHLLRVTRAINRDPVDRICQGRPAPTNDERALIRVVNRVLYAHEIQYEYTRTANVAGRLAADISQVSTSNASRPLIPASSATSSSAVPGSATAVTSATEAVTAENAQVAALQAGLASAGPTVPGVRATVGVGSYGNAALNEFYISPMAVGFNVAASYAVRDAIVTYGQTTDESDAQLADVRLFCDPAADPASTAPLSPVEQIVCENTIFVAHSRSRGVSLAVPLRCKMTSRSEATPTPLSSPFQPIGKQLRDTQTRALAF